MNKTFNTITIINRNERQIAVLVSALLMGGGTYAQNGAQAQRPKAYMVSDAHLDTQWNWDI